MPNEVTVTSTTDSQEAVDAAASYGGAAVLDQQPDEAPEKPEPEAEPEEPAKPAEPETAPEEEKPEEEEEPAAEDEVVGKTRRKLMRKVNELNNRNWRLQEQLEETQKRLRQFERPGDQPQAAVPSGRPDPRDPRFKTTDEYVEALADWRISEREKAKHLEEQEQYFKGIWTDYGKQCEQARDKHEDFDEVVNREDPLPMIAINEILEMPNGAEVAYFLGKHPEVREELLEWNEPFVRGGKGKIFTRLHQIAGQLAGNGHEQVQPSNNGSRNPQSKRTAPAPYKPVGGSNASTRSAKNPGELNFQDYKKWYAKEYGPGRYS